MHHVPRLSPTQQQQQQRDSFPREKQDVGAAICCLICLGTIRRASAAVEHSLLRLVVARTVLAAGN